MARWIGVIALMLGLGMTTYFAQKEQTTQTTNVVAPDSSTEVHTMMEGGEQPPRP
jgi:lipopolysaccharide export system protein LptC